MRFGGLQRFSMIDFAEKVCAIAFTQGCNFRCPYCHNPELVEPHRFGPQISEIEILDFLRTRKGQLDGLVITGGEPTLHPDLPDFIGRVKDLGFLVKLDSNGTNPVMLKKIFDAGLVDYLAMDIKAPIERYSEIVRTPFVQARILESISLIMNSGIAYEFRTTIVASLLNKNDILVMANMIKGARLYVLQRFLPTKTVDVSFLGEKTYSDEEFEIMRLAVAGLVKRCVVR